MMYIKLLVYVGMGPDDIKGLLITEQTNITLKVIF